LDCAHDRAVDGFAHTSLMALGRPIYALILLVALKIGIDLYTHLRVHRAPE